MAVDPAFKGVGKKEGLEIFRIEVCTSVYMQLANNGHARISCDFKNLWDVTSLVTLHCYIHYLYIVVLLHHIFSDEAI